MVCMKLLTATRITQGVRQTDYSWTTEGELVFVQEISSDCDDLPGVDTGVSRGFAGLSSHRATTTALVRDLPLTRQDVREALRGYLEATGFAGTMTADELEAVLDEEVDAMIRIGGHWPVGAVVERDRTLMRSRGMAPLESAS